MRTILLLLPVLLLPGCLNPTQARIELKELKTTVDSFRCTSSGLASIELRIQNLLDGGEELKDNSARTYDLGERLNDRLEANCREAVLTNCKMTRYRGEVASSPNRYVTYAKIVGPINSLGLTLRKTTTHKEEGYTSYNTIVSAKVFAQGIACLKRQVD